MLVTNSSPITAVEGMPSHAPEGLGRRHLGRTQGRPESGDGADKDGGADTSAPGNGGDGDEFVCGGGVDGGGKGARSDAGGPSDDGQEDGFGEELDADVALGG